jgi:hypothetical protein
MTTSSLSRFIFDLYVRNTDEIRKYKSMPETFMKGYDLTPEEKKALLSRDYAYLYCSGVHPILVSHMIQIDEVANEEKGHEGYAKEYIPKIKDCKNSYQDYYRS